ncbi:MAG: NAD kinase [Acidimicrobiia bacterium]|nr:MAG: NAD kinase [Acidimicrobiia bacterium]
MGEGVVRLGLVVHGHRPSAREFARSLTAAAPKLGLEVVDEGADVLVAVGGDGTVLEAVRRALPAGIPVLGFNLGMIGFLAEAEVAQLEVVLTALAEGRYRVEERMTVMVEVEGRTELGVNDVVVEKVDSQRLVVLGTEIDGERFLTYRADGLVVATPTGSTAYSMSAGGPLVDPRVECLLVTPVAPHSLFDRTLVLPADAHLRVTVEADRTVRVSADGVEVATVGKGGTMEIRRGDTSARFVRLDHLPFTTRVVRKFNLDDG